MKQTSHVEPTDEFVRFCCICGQRKDEPYGDPRCITPSYEEGGGYESGKHIWGNPERMYRRVFGVRP